MQAGHSGKIRPDYMQADAPFIVAIGGTTRSGSSTEKALRIALNRRRRSALKLCCQQPT